MKQRITTKKLLKVAHQLDLTTLHGQISYRGTPDKFINNPDADCGTAENVKIIDAIVKYALEKNNYFHVLDSQRILNPQNLMSIFNVIFEHCPAFLPVFIRRLAASYKKKNQLADFSLELSEIIKSYNLKKSGKEICQIILTADVDISTFLVKMMPQRFFNLPYPIQNRVHHELLRENQLHTPSKESKEKKHEFFEGSGEQKQLDTPSALAKITATVKKSLDIKDESEVAASEGMSDVLTARVAADDRATKAILTEQADAKIHDYLRQINVGSFKKEFFLWLRKEINLHGFQPEKCKPEEITGDYPSTSYIGMYAKKIEKNRAYVKEELYEASWFTGKSRAEALFRGLSSLSTINHGADISQKIKNVSPFQTNNSPFDKVVYSHRAKLSHETQILQRSEFYNKAAAEAVYQSYLLKKAIQFATDNVENRNKCRFDLQGHVLVTISLDEKDYNEIISKITGQEVKKCTKEEVEKHLGGPITDKIYCSLDITKNETLKQAFYAWLVHDEEKSTLGGNYKRLEETSGLSSIIPLQQEMEMHISLMANVLRETLNDALMGELKQEPFKDEEWQHILEATYAKINELVQSTLIQIYNKYKKINLRQLNKALDLHRTTISFQSKNILFSELAKIRSGIFKGYIHSKKTKLEAVMEKFGYVLPEHISRVNKIKISLKEQSNKKTYEKRTAINFDTLTSSHHTKIITRTTGTSKTAHDKTPGTKMALRNLRRGIINDHDSKVTPMDSTEFRVPSIAVYHDLSLSESIKDVKAKIKEIFAQVSELGHKEPVVYNLLTSFSPFYSPDEFYKNHQTSCAERILKGAHQFNREQITRGDTQLCWVMDIPVNRHGSSLSDSNSVVKEARLMTEISFLYTLHQRQLLLPVRLREVINHSWAKVYQTYVAALEYYNEGFISESHEGIRINKQLDDFKKLLVTMTPEEQEQMQESQTDHLSTLATQALAKIFSHNLHTDLEFGLIIQAINMFLEPVKFAGCKSADERYPVTSQAAEILLSAANQGLSAQQRGLLIKGFKEFICARFNPSAALRNLRNVIEKISNDSNIHTQTIISHVDQGAPPKLETEVQGGYIHNISTNTCLSSNFSAVHAKYASKLQPHKGGASDMIKALMNCGVVATSKTKAEKPESMVKSLVTSLFYSGG